MAEGAALWKEVDEYLTDHLIPADPVLEEAQAANAAAGLPAIDVAPNQGKLLHLLARVAGARKILEIGTLGGYSTTWLARALPQGGRLITLEFDAIHAEVARKNIARAGLDKVVTVRQGAALDTLPLLAEEGEGPFDLIFIDADKKNLANYLTWSLKLSRKGTLILVDNVIRDKLLPIVLPAVPREPSLMTDEATQYRKQFRHLILGHGVVNHTAGE